MIFEKSIIIKCTKEKKCICAWNKIRGNAINKEMATWKK
jgi:hypothetical protein